VSWPTELPGLDTPARIRATCVLGAGVEAAIVWRFGWSAPLPAFCYFGAVAAAASVSDVASRRIPNRAVLPAYLIGPALLALASAASGSWWPLARGGIATVLLVGFYLTLGLGFRGGLGLGDVKWAGVVGLYLGWLGWSAVFTGTLLAFLAAALLVIARRVAISQIHEAALPMAPFMTGGALVAMLAMR
jgi:leader peptidase (prepilin peptidase)/N-methyltransferase